MLLSVESAPFGRAGLKFGSEGRRAGEGTRPYADARALPPIGRGRSQTGPRAATWGRPYEIRGTLRSFRRGRRPRRPAGAHCAPLRRKTAPGRWFGNGRRKSGTAPTPIFHKPRAQWPGGNLERHSDFARRKCRTTYQEGVLRNGVRGKRPMGLGVAKRSRSPSDASPVAFCLLFRHGKRRSPPAGSEISRAQRAKSELCPLIRPLRGHLPPRGKALRGRRNPPRPSKNFTQSDPPASPPRTYAPRCR